VTLLLLAICVGLGHNINIWLRDTGIALPQFLTAMFVGILLTNLADTFKLQVSAASINRAGEISLHLFLAISLMSIQLWISVLAIFVVFRFTGRDYDASVIAAGFMGLGLGATPVAMANMQALTSRYGPSTKAFIVVPLVGAFFIDLSNAIVIKAFASLPLLREGLIMPGG
jgi:ESS family glutamate:Na+ symporter